MGHRITIRLDAELARWLAETSAKTGVSQGKIIRDQLEEVRANARTRPFMRLAGVVRGPKDLSTARQAR